MKRPQTSPAPPAIDTNDEHAELARLAGDVQRAWVILGQACKVTDAVLGTMDEAEAEAAQDIANDKLDAVISAMCAAPAHTIGGLIIKARITTIDSGGMFDGVRRSIVRDLLALDGGAERYDMNVSGVISQKSHDDTSAPPSRRSVGGARSRRRPSP
jgi:hypothetical protein